jgi:hypothetical protein
VSPHTGPPVSDISPGTYVIELTATGGSRKGARASGTLWLATLPAEVPFDESVVLYGSLQSDLGAIGAPLCSDKPSPQSRDPRAPGVLVHRNPRGTIYLTIASASHIYDPGYVTMDGCGIVLFPDAEIPGHFSGRWDALGIVHDGCGSFVARKDH